MLIGGNSHGEAALWDVRQVVSSLVDSTPWARQTGFTPGVPCPLPPCPWARAPLPPWRRGPVARGPWPMALLEQLCTAPRGHYVHDPISFAVPLRAD